MNAIGIGFAVGLGAVVGNFVVGNYLLIELVACFLVYGFLAGLIFEAYKLAFRGVHIRFPPWRS